MSQPESAPADDRRIHSRLNLEAEVGFASETNFYTGFTEDISEGGIFMATYDLKPLGTEMEVNFTLPNGVEVKAIGVVRWLRDPHDISGDLKPGMGIQFVNLTDEQRKAISEFIAARAPMFYDDDL